MQKKSKKKDTLGYRTESELKAEALERRRLEALVAAKKKPKSAVEIKAENFWYHYGRVSLGALIALALAVFFVKDVFFKTKPDLTIVMVAARIPFSEELAALQREIERYVPDYNGDGKVLVAVDAIPNFPAEAEVLDMETMYNYSMKLMAVVAANADPVYLMDKAGYEGISAMGAPDQRIFMPLGVPGAEGDALPLSSTVLETAGIAPFYEEELALYYRDITPSKKNAAYFENCLGFLEMIGGG